MLVLGDAGLCLMRLGERGFHTILNKSVSNTHIAAHKFV